MGIVISQIFHRQKAQPGQSFKPISSNKGQIVVEYILLLMVGVMIATIITTTMVSRSNESPGFLIAKWRQIIEAIGSDPTDDPQ